MKKTLFLLGVSMLLMWNTVAYATFTSGSTGADGPFNPLVNTEVDLSAYVEGDKGRLNFTTINIPAGVTVTFRRNAANTPVYMLATGDVNIAGTINVAGGNGTSTIPGVGGPGGFDGGFGGGTGLYGGRGLGPGGGAGGTSGSSSYGAGGGFGTAGASVNGIAGGGAYGNPRLLPLNGGSGGGGGGGSTARNGGGGGGAILVASSGIINVTGSINAKGGVGAGASYINGGSGSGGAIKLVANAISGDGTISAPGGSTSNSGAGGAGRIRIEAYANNRTAGTDPPYTFGLPSSVFPANLPSLSISSIAGAAVPASPTGAYNQPDLLLPSGTSNPVAVNISAEHIPVGTAVKVWVIPQYGSATSVDAILSGTDQASAATANVNLSTTYSNVVTAEATFTILQAMYWNGEEIEKVKVATRLGGGSETVYITASGKEIPGDLIAGLYR